MGVTKRKKKRFGMTILLFFGTIFTIALIGFGVWKMLIVPPDVGQHTPTLSPVGDSEEQNGSGNGTQNDADPDGEVLNARKESYYTFLLLGKDTGGGGNTDTMMLVSYDVEAGTLDLVTIPRDTMINVPWSIKKINAVYSSSRGVDGLKTEIGHLTGVVPDFYIAVEWEAIGEIVDALNGVYFDVPYDMDYDDPYQDLSIHQEKGYRLLSGDDAMQVIRWRSNNDDSPCGYHRSDGGVGDTGRQKIQRDFLTAVAQQCLQLKNWTKISAFAEAFFENVETDIPWNNLLWFAEQAMELSVENIVFHALPGNDEGWYYTPSLGVNLSYFFADPEGILELVNAHFNPYTSDITEERLQIVFKNEDASLGVTNGELADPQMAIPSVKPPSAQKSGDDTDEDTADEELPGDGAADTDPSPQEEKQAEEDGSEPTLPAENNSNTDDSNS